MSATKKLILLENLVIEKDFNSRMLFDDEKMDELKKSIVSNGLYYPITVKKIEINPDNINNYEIWKNKEKIDCSDVILGKEIYVIIGGERRYRAHVELIEEGHEFKGITCIIAKSSMKKDVAVLTSYIENMGEPFSPVEEAILFDKLINIYKWSIEDVSQKIGKRVGTIKSRLTFIDASNELQEAIINKEVTLSTAKEIIKQSDGDINKQNEELKEIKDTGIDKIKQEKKKKKEEKIKEKIKKEIKQEMTHDELDEGECCISDDEIGHIDEKTHLSKSKKKTFMISFDDWKEEIDQIVYEIKQNMNSGNSCLTIYSYSRLCALLEILNGDIEDYISDEKVDHCENLLR